MSCRKAHVTQAPRIYIMTLKSVTAAPLPDSAYTAKLMDWSVPLPDGTALTESYRWEEARLAQMREGLCGPLAYVWVPARSISLSKREAIKLGVKNNVLQSFQNEPLATRGTGGTAVPQGPGTANITLFTRHTKQPDITDFYHQMCAALASGFDALGLPTTIGARPGSFCDGDFNLLHNGKKLAGTAQRWARGRSGETLGVHHVVVLTGGAPAQLCARLETLYAAGGYIESYIPDVHYDGTIDIADLRQAMAQPLRALVGT